MTAPTYSITVRLAILCPDGCVILEDDDLPGFPLEATDRLEKKVGDLCLTTIGINPDHWLRLQQMGFIDIPGTDRTVLYAVMVPERVPLIPRGARWMTVDEMLQPEAAITEATLHLISRAVRYREL